MNRPAALAALALLAACGPAVDRVEIRPRQTVLMAAGASAVLEAVPRDAGGAPLEVAVQWASAAPEVATVDAAGRVTAVRTGEAPIVARAAGATAEARVRVSIPVRAWLEPHTLELTGLPSQATLQLRMEDERKNDVSPRRTTWTSSNEAVVRVAGGRVQAVGPGQATVAAAEGGLSASAVVTVRLPAFARVGLKPGRLALAVGQSARLEAAALDGSGAAVKGVPLAYASSDPQVAVVTQDGTVTARKPGRAQVTAASGGKSAAAVVIVRK